MIQLGQQMRRKGGKTIVNRILKDGANVSPFFVQTFISSLCDQECNDTTGQRIIEDQLKNSTI
jgi:hypothetical protein